MNDVIVDLETMGNTPNAAIIAIGAVAFDANGVGSTFYEIIDLESSVKLGGVIDPSTVIWWMKQSDAARAEFERKGVNLAEALLNFSEWCGFVSPKNALKVWGNGAAFDNVILASAYRNCSLNQPWEFWNDRCYRTIKSLNPSIPMVRSGTHHNALSDAISQAEHLISILKVTR